MECCGDKDTSLLESEWTIHGQGLSVSSQDLEKLRTSEAELRSALEPGMCSISVENENGYKETIVSASGVPVSFVDPVESQLQEPSPQAPSHQETYDEARYIREFLKFKCCSQDCLHTKFDHAMIHSAPLP